MHCFYFIFSTPSSFVQFQKGWSFRVFLPLTSLLIYSVMRTGRRKEQEKQQIVEDFCIILEDGSVLFWFLQNNQVKMHFKCHYKTDTLSLIISIVGTLKALRLELLFTMFRMKIIVNEIIPTNCEMLDFLIVNKCNSEKLLQLYFIDRSQSTIHSLIVD